MNSNVAVIGLGAMGLPMAARLAERFEVRGFDIAAERLALAADQGVAPAVTAAEAVTGAGTVLVAVRTGEQLDTLLYGSGNGLNDSALNDSALNDTGIAVHLEPGAVVVLTSTVGTDGIAETAERLAEQDVHLVDAPLSGGPVRAREGDLLIVVGAAPAAVEKVKPVLTQLSSTLSIVGDRPGDGQALKTVNQLLCGVHIAAAAEALALADALGLDRERTLGALTAGAANSFMLGNRGPRALQAYDEGGAEVLSRLDIFVKDLGIVGKAARNAHLAAPVAAAAEQLFLLGEAQGLGALDDSAVIRVVAPQLRAKEQ
ncbi:MULTISPECIES: NAD(P)-dependent oxidoreductase [Glycomyces]|uniref:3-hydroxyisobutyrate dehydrogenase n=2 Tax=Glycomyces TaxID=58113 RepID=A0A9X3PGI3_9ACTN|nr:NAD(P)-dependent oxidoreductase [Glycomyces lechevalierae]MDA1383734.1 NAD(P)-dependent oxidoreductase [Glycomyces lechevalierae]MDR7341275.1 3-hydroxyisobutyrate dehydrogenase [Glycomyces lechevalierae]